MTLFDSVPDFLFVLDQDGLLTSMNQNILTRLGYRREELVGQTMDVFPTGPNRSQISALPRGDLVR